MVHVTRNDFVWRDIITNIPQAMAGNSSWAYIGVHEYALNSTAHTQKNSLFVGVQSGGTKIKVAYGTPDTNYYVTAYYLSAS